MLSAHEALERLREGNLRFASDERGPEVFVGHDRRAELAVTPAAVQRVAKQYLTPGRVVLSMVPAGQASLASRPDRPLTNVTPIPEK